MAKSYRIQSIRPEPRMEMVWRDSGGKFHPCRVIEIRGDVSLIQFIGEDYVAGWTDTRLLGYRLVDE
jgi:hypothetical protein